MPKLLHRIFALLLENYFLKVKWSTSNNKLGRDLRSTIWGLPASLTNLLLSGLGPRKTLVSQTSLLPLILSEFLFFSLICTLSSAFKHFLLASAQRTNWLHSNGSLLSSCGHSLTPLHWLLKGCAWQPQETRANPQDEDFPGPAEELKPKLKPAAGIQSFLTGRGSSAWFCPKQDRNPGPLH